MTSDSFKFDYFELITPSGERLPVVYEVLLSVGCRAELIRRFADPGCALMEAEAIPTAGTMVTVARFASPPSFPPSFGPATLKAEEGIEMTSPLHPIGKITLFVDGFGVEVDSGYIVGTSIRDGDSVSSATLSQLGRLYRSRAVRRARALCRAYAIAETGDAAALAAYLRDLDRDIAPQTVATLESDSVCGDIVGDTIAAAFLVL